jgi:hypothetical protein
VVIVEVGSILGGREMMKSIRELVVVLMVVSMAIMTSTPVLAQQAEAVKNAPKIAVPRVSEAGFAREMAVNGRQLQDPYLLIQAAELLITAGKLPGPKAQVKAEKPSSEKKISLEPAGLLREAAKMAGGAGDRRAVEMAAELARNATVGLGNESLADEISKTEVARGLLRGGSWTGTGCLNAGEVAASEFRFNKNEDAGVVLSTGNYLPVDIYVFDDSGGLITGDDSSSNNKTVAWHTGKEVKLVVAIKANYGGTCYAAYIP